MKTLLAIIAFGAALIGASSCADLGFGVDVDSGPYGNYWYPNGYLGDYSGIPLYGIMARSTILYHRLHRL